MREGERLRLALIYADAWGATSRVRAFRRIAELLIETRGRLAPDLHRQAIAALERLRPAAPSAEMEAVKASVAEHWPDPGMLEFRDPPEGQAQMRSAMPLARPASGDPAIEDGARQVQSLLNRLRVLREKSGNAPSPDSQLAALAGAWWWECDAQGRITALDGGQPPLSLGETLFSLAGIDPMWEAVRRRVPFRDVVVLIDDAPWGLSGVPFFSPGDGKFLGYRGTAARPRPVGATGLLGTVASADALAEVAHEVRSPLNAIMGFAQMIESETLGPVAEPQRREASRILENATRLLSAIDDLTDAARLDRGLWPREREAVEVQVLLAQVVDRYRPLAGSRGVDLALTHAGGGGKIDVDGRMLERALSRLFAAVLSACVAGETLLLGVRHDAEGLQLFLTKPAALEYLSEQQLIGLARDRPDADSPAITKLGMNFGLRLVRRLVEAMDSSFVVEPHEFTITLPSGVAGERSVANGAENA